MTGSNIINVLKRALGGCASQSRTISNAQELTMQLSQTLSSAIAQIKFSNSPITNHTKRYCPCALLLFSISVKPKGKFLVECFNGGGLSSSFFFFFSLAAVVVEERCLIDVFPL